MLTILILTGITILFLSAIRRRLTPPLMLALSLYMTIAIAGILNSESILDLPFGMEIAHLSEDAISKTAQVLLISAISFSIPFGLALSNDKKIERPATEIKLSNKTVIIMTILPLTLYLISHGPGLFYRAEYIPQEISENRALSICKIIGRLISPIAVIAVTIRYKNKTGPLLLALAVIMMPFFATSSRIMIVLSSCIIIGLILAKAEITNHKKQYSIAFALLIISLIVPLQMRSLPTHGLIPYTLEIMQNGLNFSELIRMSNYVVSYSFSLTGSMIESKINLGINHLVISLDPRPGTVAGWLNIRDSLRFNLFAPYPAIGEIYSHGMIALITYFATCGMAFALSLKLTKRKSSKLETVTHYTILTLSIIFIVTALQYNLRSTTRITYYAVTALAFYKITEHIIKLIRNTNHVKINH